jgi:hypothetical protein
LGGRDKLEKKKVNDVGGDDGFGN